MYMILEDIVWNQIQNMQIPSFFSILWYLNKIKMYGAKKG